MPGLLAVVGQQAALAARLRDARDAQAARPAAPAEHLERLQQLVEVAHLDRAVMAQQRREGARRADHRARVGERRARRGLRAPDLEADDRLARLGRERERRGEGVRAPDRLDEQADRRVPSSLGQERDEVGEIARELAPGRDDRAEADARPAGQERLGDRARVRDAGDVPGHERLGPGDRAEPERDAAGRRDAHAVRARRPRCRTRRRARAMRAATARPSAPASAPRPGQHDRAHAGRDHVLEGRLGARVADQQERALRASPAAPSATAKHSRPSTVGPVRVDEPGRHAAAPAPARDRRRPRRVRSLAPTTATERGKSKGRIPPRRSAAVTGRALRARSRPPPARARRGGRACSCSKRPGSCHQASTPARGSTTRSPTRSRKRAEMRGPKTPSAASCAVGHDPRVVAEQLARAARAASSSAPSRTCRKRSRAEPAGASGRPSAPRAQQRHELRAALVDVDAALGVGRQLAVVGEQQHERARRARERVHELLLDAPRAASSATASERGSSGPSSCPMRVEVVEVEQRERRRRCPCEARRERGARARALDAVDRRRPRTRCCVNGVSTVSAGCTQVAARPEPAEPGGETVGLRVDRAQIGAGRDQAAGRLAGERRPSAGRRGGRATARRRTTRTRRARRRAAPCAASSRARSSSTEIASSTSRRRPRRAGARAGARARRSARRTSSRARRRARRRRAAAHRRARAARRRAGLRARARRTAAAACRGCARSRRSRTAAAPARPAGARRRRPRASAR